TVLRIVERQDVKRFLNLANGLKMALADLQHERGGDFVLPLRDLLDPPLEQLEALLDRTSGPLAPVGTCEADGAADAYLSRVSGIRDLERSIYRTPYLARHLSLSSRPAFDPGTCMARPC